MLIRGFIKGLKRGCLYKLNPVLPSFHHSVGHFVQGIMVFFLFSNSASFHRSLIKDLALVESRGDFGYETFSSPPIRLSSPLTTRPQFFANPFIVATWLIAQIILLICLKSMTWLCFRGKVAQLPKPVNTSLGIFDSFPLPSTLYKISKKYNGLR